MRKSIDSAQAAAAADYTVSRCVEEFIHGGRVFIGHMMFPGDSTMPIQSSSLNGPLMRHAIAVPQVLTAPAGGVTGSVSPATNPPSDSRMSSSMTAASAQQIHQGQYISYSYIFLSSVLGVEWNAYFKSIE